MAKDLSKNQDKIVKNYYAHHDTIQMNKLSEIVSDLWLAEDEKKKTKLWGKAQIALMRLEINATLVAGIVAKRDLEALAKLVAQVDAGGAQKPADNSTQQRSPSLADGRTIKQMREAKNAEHGHDSLAEDNLKHALRAFKKKLKLMIRDDESRLGGRYVSAGRTSNITAITPPREFPSAVWEKLVETNRLKRAGQGTYELP